MADRTQRVRSSITLLAAATLVALWAALPLAAGTDSRATELAEEASALVREGDYELAAEKLRAALELEPQQLPLRFHLARILASLGRYEESLGEFAAVVAAQPQNVLARRGEVTALLLLERYAEARARLEEGLTAMPRAGQLAHTLARLLATAPDPGVRDGELALRLALSVYEVKKLYQTGETVAMAYAETGDFERAIAMQEELIARAVAEGDGPRAEQLGERLAAYRRQQPWRAVSAAEIATATEPPSAGG